MTSYGYIIMIIVDSCIIWFHLVCIMYLKWSCFCSNACNRKMLLLLVISLTVYSGAGQRKHQNSASLAFVREIHRWPVNSSHKWPVTRKMLPFDDVIMGQMGKSSERRKSAMWFQIYAFCNIWSTTRSRFGRTMWPTHQSTIKNLTTVIRPALY